MAIFRRALTLSGALVIVLAGSAQAADQWIEVRSAHFTVTSNASRAAASSAAWQLEQVRSAIAAFWPWAQVELNKPLAVLAVKDESTMKALVPAYWEQRNSVHPVSVWATGADQHYMAIRTDIPSADARNVNPYTTSFFTYVTLILNQSLPHDLPLWCSRGIAAVFSNTLIRSNEMLVGAPVPWYLERIANRSRLPIASLLQVTRSSREFTTEEGLQRFDAQAWALVHFLLMSDNGARAGKLNAFINSVAAGADPDQAFRREIGRPEDLEAPLGAYVSRSVFGALQARIDVTVKREGFTVRSLTAAEAAGLRALFLAATNRPADARAAIAEARNADPSGAASYVAEGLLLDREGRKEEARGAFGRAVEGGSDSSYAAYRLAHLLWQGKPDRQTFERIEGLFSRAIEKNPRNAAAYAGLGEVRSILGSGEPLALVSRAISLEPNDGYYHLVAANVLWRQQKWDDALNHARKAAALADNDENKRAAADKIASIERARNLSAAQAAQQSAVRAEADARALSTKCESGDREACAAVLPLLEASCAKGNGQACGMAAWLYDTGSGVAVDPGRAAELWRKACDAGEQRACVTFAGVQARGRGVPKDEALAVATLNRLCTNSVVEACTELAVVLASRQPPDFGRARALLTTACEAKDDRACTLLKGLPR